MRHMLIAMLALLATPAFAQFPPPGIYACVAENGDRLGTLSLLTAGDYQWDTQDGASAMGQIASAGNSVQALSGPLGLAHWKGVFALDARGEAAFQFDSDDGKISCALPPL